MFLVVLKPVDESAPDVFAPARLFWNFLLRPVEQLFIIPSLVGCTLFHTWDSKAPLLAGPVVTFILMHGQSLLVPANNLIKQSSI